MSPYIVRFNHKRKQIFKSQKMRQLFSWFRLTPYSGFWTSPPIPLPLRLGPHQLSPPSLLSSISSPAHNTSAHFPQYINIFKSISYFKNKNKTYLHLIDHTAPPNVTICYRSLALRLEITRHERRRRCPPSFPSGTLLEVHSSVKKDTWFSKRFDALHHRPAFPQNCRLTPLFKNPRLWASGSTEHFLTRGAETVVWPLTFFQNLPFAYPLFKK